MNVAQSSFRASYVKFCCCTNSCNFVKMLMTVHYKFLNSVNFAIRIFDLIASFCLIKLFDRSPSLDQCSKITVYLHAKLVMLNKNIYKVFLNANPYLSFCHFDVCKFDPYLFLIFKKIFFYRIEPHMYCISIGTGSLWCS